MYNKSMKKFIIFAVLFVLLANTSYAYQDTLEREYTLLTSYDPKRFARFTADGDMIHAEGFFIDSTVDDFYISTSTMRGIEQSFTRNPDGSFTASFGGIPTEKNARAVIKFTDGTVMSYRVEYNNGWFFGDNGLAAKTAATLENYSTAALVISENYISATLDPFEISQTRDKLLEIVATVTAGVDDDYEKARLLNIWVADNIVYDRDARDSEVTEETVSVATTLRLGRSVCIGIANTYGALLEAAGLKVLNIKGGIANVHEGVPYELLAEKTLPHEWVAFWYETESRWVYADPTWDRKGFFEYGNYQHRQSVIKHFDISGLALSFDHRGDRAELRNYFPEPVGDGVPDVPPLETPPLENGQTESSAPTTTAPLNSHDPLPPYPVEENNILLLAIGAMSLIVLLMLAVTIKNRKG